MKRLTALPALLLLGMCTHVPTPSCKDADRVRNAAALALQTLDRVCPMGRI